MSSKNSLIRVFPEEISRVMNNGGKVVVTYTRNGKVQLPIRGKLMSEPKSDSKCIDLDLSTENEKCFRYVPASSEHFAVRKLPMKMVGFCT